MWIDTHRFGSFELDENKIIFFATGLPGFEELHKFVILEIEDTKPLFWLQSVEDKYVSLPIINPYHILMEYDMIIREHDIQDLYVENQEDLFVMNVVVLTDNVEDMIANLAAPIIINAKLGLGKQILIDANVLPAKYPIYEAVMRVLKGGKEDACTV